MSGQINRAAELWQNWAEKEKMLLDIFGHSSLSENLNREKYNFLSQGISRISKDTIPDEKLVLGLIKKASVRLEKQLYPHPVLRLLHRVKKLIYDNPMQTARAKKVKAENVVSLTSALGKIGLNAEKINLEQRLGSESQKLEIELLSPYGTSNYSVKLNLEKDGAGHYQMLSYTGTLKDPMNPEHNRTYTFDAALGINTREAVNLLQGRAVMKYDHINANRMASKWVQLDFKNLSPEGKPQLKETSADYEYNLGQEVKKVAQVLSKPELDNARVLDGLEKGHQIALKQVTGETTYLEADPLGKSITVRYANGQQTTLDNVLEKRKKEQELKPEMKLTKTRTRQKQQSQNINME